MNRPFPIQPVVSLADPLPKGMGVVRALIASGLHPKSPHSAEAFAANRWGDDSAPLRVLKAAVSAGNTSDNPELVSSASAPLVEFMNAVYAQTALDKLIQSGLRRRAAGTRYLVNTGTAKGGWVGEGKSVPVLPFSFDQSTLNLLKVAAIVVLTKESLEAADSATEAGIRADIISGLAEAIDTALLDPANTGTPGETPASLTAGLTPIAIGTGDQDDVRQGLSRMIEDFAGDLSRAVFIGSPQLFAMLNGYGYEDVGIRGGTLLGAPAVATKGLPNAGGFYQLALVDPTGIAYTDDPSATQFTASQNAALQMDDSPTNDAVTPTPTNLVSCFQSNCVALKGMIWANWSVERAGAVSVMYAFPEAAAS
jgi:hypothetical protein